MDLSPPRQERRVSPTAGTAPQCRLSVPTGHEGRSVFAVRDYLVSDKPPFTGLAFTTRGEGPCKRLSRAKGHRVWGLDGPLCPTPLGPQARTRDLTTAVKGILRTPPTSVVMS